uniref:Glycine oxidase ThiO n=1 Tax=Thermorudis peleae TaxID=1382356 RepID=A0A831WZ49_9BACT
MGVEGKQVSTRSETSPEVIVVGGGVIGTAIAYAFARRGISCLVLERGIIGQGTSEASAGIVSPPSTSAIPAERLELARRSFQAYPWLVAAVQEDSGLDAGYRQWGELLVAETEDEVIPLRELAAWQASAGFESEWVDGKTAREIEPLLPERIHGALLADEGGSLIVQRLVRALALAAASRGARVVERAPVTGFTVEGDRVVALETRQGRYVTGQVVLAAGAWTGHLAGQLGRTLPTLPVKGQMTLISGGATVLRHVLGSADGAGYLAPRTDGLIWAGGTKERGEWDTRVTPAGIAHCLRLVERLAPTLLEGELVALGAGLRPGTPDGEPIIGPLPGYSNVWVATGHYRTGVQLAPATADLVVEGMLCGEPDPLLAPFSPARFVQAQ